MPQKEATRMPKLLKSYVVADNICNFSIFLNNYVIFITILSFFVIFFSIKGQLFICIMAFFGAIFYT